MSEKAPLSKFSLALNMMLLREQLYIYPRASAAVLAINLIAAGINLAFAPSSLEGWQPSALEGVLYLWYAVAGLALGKLTFALLTYRSRMEQRYPGSQFVSAGLVMALFFVIAPFAFWMISRVRGSDYEPGSILILTIIAYPLMTLWFWVCVLTAHANSGRWPSWIPRE